MALKIKEWSLLLFTSLILSAFLVSGTITTPSGAQTDSNCGFPGVYCNLGIDDIQDIFVRNYEDDDINGTLHSYKNLEADYNVTAGNRSQPIACYLENDGTFNNLYCNNVLRVLVNLNLTEKNLTSVSDAYVKNLHGWSDINLEDNLDGTGYNASFANVNASGNVTADNVWLLAYLSAHTNSTIAVASGGTWYNITFDQEASGPKERISHTYNDGTNNTITLQDTGIYQVSYTISFQDSAVTPNSHVVARVVKNGIEVNGTAIEQDIAGAPVSDKDMLISHHDIFSANAGDQLKLQFAADDTTVSLKSHMTYGDHQTSAHIHLQRIG